MPTITFLEHRNGFTDAVWLSALDLFERVEAVAAPSAARGPRSFDGSAEAADQSVFLIPSFTGKTQLISASLLQLLSLPDVQTLSLR